MSIENKFLTVVCGLALLGSGFFLGYKSGFDRAMPKQVEMGQGLKPNEINAAVYIGYPWSSDKDSMTFVGTYATNSKLYEFMNKNDIESIIFKTSESK